METRISRRDLVKKGGIAAAAVLLGASGIDYFRQTSSAKAEEKEDRIFYFPETGHHLEDPFLEFWQTNGGALIFGLPITEVIDESGMPVQYCEKARLELQPDGRIMLGLLGSQLFEERGFSPSDDLHLNPKFSLFYENRGGLEIFGYPISPVLEEKGRLVQYFQRSRFEYHPEALDPFYRAQEKKYGLTLLALNEVQLADLGEMFAEKAGIALDRVVPKTGAIDYDLFAPSKKIVVNLKKQELTAFEEETPVLETAVSTGLVVPGVLAGTPTGDYQVLGKYKELTYSGWNPYLRVSYVYYRVPFNLHFWPPSARLYLIHGAYWHADFGRTRSLGCINLDLSFAEQIYSWAEIGTPIKIVPS